MWEKTYSLAQCNQCGSAFTVDLPDDVTLENFYRVAFDYRWYQDHLPAKIRDSEIRIQEYAKLLGRRVLDFGGGLGYFSQTARKYGYESVTYDPFAGGMAPLENDWDTVVGLHMLEHASDPDRICTQIKKFLKAGGRVIFAVPNFDGLGYRTFGMRWVWAQPPLMHVFHFTAKGLRALLTRHGFQDLEVSYHERWDANMFCDVENAAATSRWDAAWGLRPFNAIPLYRKWIARHNSARRFEGLNHALADFDKTCDQYAELQITGILSAQT
ncbi:MAG TPA: class I SAM-dependent methyltransferase [Paucimonas sp.]|nr:class I SAM-dependent methyltransferase [Paucimonas sp.]